MKLYHPLVFVLSIVCFVLNGQVIKAKLNSTLIIGKVYDSKTKEAVPFANVAYRKSGVLLAGVQTDIKGNFAFNDVVTDSISLEVSYIGYHTKVIISIPLKERGNLNLDIPLKKGVIESANTNKIYPSCTGPVYNIETVTYAEVQSAYSVKGQLRDASTKEVILFGNIAVYKDGVLVAGRQSDIYGNFEFKNLPKGSYRFEGTYIGYKTKRITGVVVDQDIQDLVINLSEGPAISCGFNCSFPLKKALKRIEDTTSSKIFAATEISPKSQTPALKHTEKKNKKTEPQTTQDIHLYPNPSSGQIYFEVSTEIQKIQLISVQGKVIDIIPFAQDGSVDLTYLSSGTYFLKFYHEYGSQIEKLIVVKH